jgi:hypothetical protein
MVFKMWKVSFMPMNKNRIKLFVAISIAVLLLPAGLNVTFATDVGSQSRGPRNVVAGPIELIKNGNFNTNQFWSYEGYNDLIAYYENTPKSANVTFLSPQVYFGPVNTWSYGYINQSISKSYSTRNTATSVNLKFDCSVIEFDGSLLVGAGTIIGYIRAYINQTQNPTPIYSQQVNINTKTAFNVDADVGTLMAGKGQFSLSLQFQINVNLGPTSTHTFDKCLVRFDNVSLQLTDKYPPNVIVNQDEYGPYNSTDPGQIIDVDFLYGGGGNNTLDIGSYRIGSSWFNVFTLDTDSYTTNWALDWYKVNEGDNTIYLRCNDTLGNSNDTEKFSIFKDTKLPQSQAVPLSAIINTSTLQIYYTTSDPLPSSGIHHIELWVADKGSQNYIKYTDLTYPSGEFSVSPVTYNSSKDGEYEFYTLAVDNASNREIAVPTSPDATTMIDTTPPTSAAGPLSEYQASITFDIPFSKSDSLSGINNVKLFYTEDDGTTWTQYQSGSKFNFTSSPITFTAPKETKYGFYTVATDNATNIELGGIPSSGTTPDVSTTVDTRNPIPKILTPRNFTHHTAKIGSKVVYVTALSAIDTTQIIFDYYNDTNNNTLPDDDNTWINIGLDDDPGNGWNVTWDISGLNADHLLVRANATDYSNKQGEGINTGIEIDNTDPIISIKSPIFGDIYANTCDIKFTTSDDAAYVILEYWQNDKWNDIDILYAPKVNDSFTWHSSFTEETEIELRATVYDEVGLSGFDMVEGLEFGRNSPIISEEFNLLEWTWDEDFTEKVRVFTQYETDVEDSGEYLKWYVTGHNKSLYEIKGNNRTDDTFTFTSIQDMWGSEIITFHLWDTDNLEDEIDVLVTINPINDAPHYTSDMPGTISVKAGYARNWDLSSYIIDVDDAPEELTLNTTDPTKITVDMLMLTLNYGEDQLFQTVNVNITVKDPDGLFSMTSVDIKISDNFPPEVSEKLPDLTIYEKEVISNYFDLDDHFMDRDGDKLSYTHNDLTRVAVTITEDGTVDFEGKSPGVETVTFKAWDNETFAESKMQVTVIDVNEPPIIEGIPDISLHYDVSLTYHLDDYIIDDNNTEDLMIWTSSELASNVQVDPDDNLALILQFPQAMIMPYDITVTVWVTDGEFTDSDEFVVTVTEFYPILLKYQIEDVEFEEDTNYTNAFDLWDYFEDLDGGSHFQAEGFNPDNLTVEILESDGEAMVNFYPSKDFYGNVKVKFIGVDTYTDSQASDTITVHITPVNDAPTINAIPDIKVEVDQPTQFNLEAYLFDIDDAIYNLTVTIDDPSVKVNGRVLTFNYSKPGTKTLTITVDDGEAQVSRDIKVIVEEEKIPTFLDYIIDYWWVIILIIIIILIFNSVVYKRLSHYTVEEVFLVHKSGILIAHRMRKPSTDYDEEIVSGMFTAVQEFIKDTFSNGDESGEAFSLQELTLGENRILLEQGEHIYMAVIFAGRGTKQLRRKTTKLLIEIESKYSDPLINWFGDMDKFKGIDQMLKILIPKEEALSEEEDPSKKGVDMIHGGDVPPPPVQPTALPPKRTPVPQQPTPTHTPQPSPKPQAQPSIQPKVVQLPPTPKVTKPEVTTQPTPTPKPTPKIKPNPIKKAEPVPKVKE